MPTPSRRPIASDETRPNTVGLRQDALNQLLDQIDRSGGKNPKAAREFVRRAYRREAVSVTVHQPGGNPVTLRMACRNLSCGGINLLHSSYLHTGTRVTVELVTAAGERQIVEGTIVRCTHVRGLIHEIGIRFSHEIQAREYIHVDPFSDSFSVERVDPEALKGTIVFVDDSTVEQRLITHYLRGTSLRLRVASTAEEAFKLVGEGCDLLITDYAMPGMNGVDLIRRLREEGYDTPVIMVTADTTAVTRASLNELRISAFLAKPFPQDMLLRAVAEFISGEASARQTSCSLPADHPNRGLVEGYVDQLHEYAKKLGDCASRGDHEGARTVALQIAGSGPNFGFEAIGKLGHAAAQTLAATGSIEESMGQVRTLQAACERSRA